MAAVMGPDRPERRPGGADRRLAHAAKWWRIDRAHQFDRRDGHDGRARRSRRRTAAGNEVVRITWGSGLIPGVVGGHPELPATLLPEEILQPGGDRVRALTVIGENPAVALPNQPRVIELSARWSCS